MFCKLCVCDVIYKYAACNIPTLRICGGNKCRVQLQAHSSANPEAREIDRKPIWHQCIQFQVKGTIELQLFIVVGMQLGWAFNYAVFKFQLHIEA